MSRYCILATNNIFRLVVRYGHHRLLVEVSHALIAEVVVRGGVCVGDISVDLQAIIITTIALPIFCFVHVLGGDRGQETIEIDRARSNDELRNSSRNAVIWLLTCHLPVLVHLRSDLSLICC